MSGREPIDTGGLHSASVWARVRALPWAEVGRWVGCAAFAYLMLRPVGFNMILLPVIAILAIVSGITVVVRRPAVAGPIRLVLGALLAVGVYGAAVGFANPGLLNGLLVWLVAPVIFGAWVIAGDPRLVRLLLATCAIVTIVLSVGILLFIAGELGILPQLIPGWLQEQGGFGFDATYVDATAIRFYGLSTLVAAAPIWLSATILPTHPLMPAKGISIAAGILAAVATMLSGRAALTVVTLLVPLVVWAVWRILTRKQSRTRWRTYSPLAVGAGFVAVIGLLVLMGNRNVINAFARLASILTGEGQGVSDRIRDRQSGELLAAWWESPVFGHGLGATIEGYSRSRDRPWDFELQYHLYLFQFGAVGALVLLLAVAAGVFGLVRALRQSPAMTPVLLVTASGALAMLIANASNPYLQAPGHMWAVYLPLMVINLTLVGLFGRGEVSSRGSDQPREAGDVSAQQPPKPAPEA